MELIVKNWQLIADKYNGRFRDILAKSPGIIDPIHNKFRRFELQIPLYGEMLILKTGENHHFKLDYRFKKWLDFELQIYPEDYFEKLSKLFGLMEIEVGNPDFDGRYIIKSNNAELVNKILDKTIQNYMIKFNLYSLQLTGENGSNLMIMPYIREQDVTELDEFIVFSGHLIKKIKEAAE